MSLYAAQLLSDFPPVVVLIERRDYKEAHKDLTKLRRGLGTEVAESRHGAYADMCLSRLHVSMKHLEDALNSGEAPAIFRHLSVTEQYHDCAVEAIPCVSKPFVRKIYVR